MTFRRSGAPAGFDRDGVVAPRTPLSPMAEWLSAGSPHRMARVIYAFDEFELDAARLELRRSGAVVHVDRLVLRVLAALLRDAGSLVTKDQLVEDVWEGRAVADNVITVSIARLRRALDDRRGEREFVMTVYGRGYRFIRPVVARAASQAPGAPTSVIPDVVPPLVGRGSVLTELRRGVAEAHLGRGRLYALIGEAGIGKTRVVSALADELVGAPAKIAWGFCRVSGSTPPLYPWLQLLRKLLDSAPSESWDQALGAAAAAELRALLQHGDSGAPEPPRREAGRTAPGVMGLRNIEVLTRAFIHAAELTPWVLVFEDLHRADGASLEVLSLLVDEVFRSRVMVVATVRDTQSGAALRRSSALRYVLGHAHTERLTLRRLSEHDVLRYVAGLVDDPDARLGRAVYAKSQGIPFFMAELMRQLRRHDRDDAEHLTLPAAALDVLHQRIAELEPDTRNLLTAAAVIGARFDLPLLQAITAQPPDALARALDHAIAADLLVCAPDSPTAFSFGHELLREVLYDALPPAERRRRHLDTALAIERHAAAAQSPARAAEVADHLHAALPDTDLAKTIAYCDRAARDAGAALASIDAARHLRHALAALALLPTPQPARRIELLLRLALYTRGSAPDLFLRSIEEILQLARERGDAASLARAAIMCQAHPELTAVCGASEALVDALALLPSEERGLRAATLAALATAAPHAYTAAASGSLLAEAESLARTATNDRCMQVVLNSKLFAQGGPTFDASSHEALEELERLGRDQPRHTPLAPLFVAMHRAVRLLQLGQQAAANIAIARGRACAREVGHPELLWNFERFEALARVNAGDCAEGEARLAALHQRASRRPTLGSATFCAFDRAVVLPALGPSQADDALRAALAYRACDVPSIWALKVRALATAGLLDDARAALAAVPAHALAALPCDSQYLGTLGHLARAAMILEVPRYMEALDDLLAPFDACFAVHASYFCEGSVTQVRGMLAQALGRAADGRALLEDGLERCERAGFLHCADEARRALALGAPPSSAGR